MFQNIMHNSAAWVGEWFHTEEFGVAVPGYGINYVDGIWELQKRAFHGGNPLPLCENKVLVCRGKGDGSDLTFCVRIEFCSAGVGMLGQ